MDEWSETNLHDHLPPVPNVTSDPIFHPPIAKNPELARKLRHHIAALVDNVLTQTSMDELYIEGGATASNIVRRLQWTRFFPCAELAPGTVRMRVKEKQNLSLTIKPGSYHWPKKIWTNTP